MNKGIIVTMRRGLQAVNSNEISVVKRLGEDR